MFSSFLIHPKPSCLGMVPPTVGWALPHHCQSSYFLYIWPQNNLMEAINWGYLFPHDRLAPSWQILIVFSHIYHLLPLQLFSDPLQHISLPTSCLFVLFSNAPSTISYAHKIMGHEPGHDQPTSGNSLKVTQPPSAAINWPQCLS